VTATPSERSAVTDVVPAPRSEPAGAVPAAAPAAAPAPAAPRRSPGGVLMLLLRQYSLVALTTPH